MYVLSCGVERKLTTWLLPKLTRRGSFMDIADEPFQSEIKNVVQKYIINVRT